MGSDSEYRAKLERMSAGQLLDEIVEQHRKVEEWDQHERWATAMLRGRRVGPGTYVTPNGNVVRVFMGMGIVEDLGERRELQ